MKLLESKDKSSESVFTKTIREVTASNQSGQCNESSKIET
jgi:hypothetical protein